MHNASKLSILANNLDNLSDVRYFAAMGADFLGFSLQKLPFEKIIELVNWTEGPAILWDLRPNDFIPNEQLSSMAQAVIVSKYEKEKYVNKTIFTEDYRTLYPGVNYIISVDAPIEELYNKGHHLYLDTQGVNQDSFETIRPYLRGLLISGGQEIKPGLKDYERLEEIFSWV